MEIPSILAGVVFAFGTVFLIRRMRPATALHALAVIALSRTREAVA